MNPEMIVGICVGIILIFSLVGILCTTGLIGINLPAQSTQPQDINPNFFVALNSTGMSRRSLRAIAKNCVSITSAYEAYRKGEIMVEELMLILELKRESDWWIIRYIKKIIT